MDLRVLEYFLAAAEEENITRASELLHVSQPTVSRQLKELEAELGRELFIRTNKKVRLTEDGILFRQTARDILRLADKARTANTDTGELEGEIHIASAEIETFGLIADKITEFRKRYPKVRFRIDSGSAGEICESIDRGTADIGLIVQSADTMKYRVKDLNTQLRWGILVHRSHRLADRETVSVKDLQGEELILPDNSRLHNDIREWLGRDEAAATYTLVHNAMILTEISGWAAVCLESRKYTDTNLRFIPLIPERTASVSLIWRDAAVYSPAMKAFLSSFGIQDVNGR